jgi:hypothetical protein
MMARLSCIALLALAALPARADDLKQVARAVFDSAQKSVVTVRLVLKISMGSRDNEQKHEAIGTVVDPSGLTVVAATAIDPTASFRAAMHARGSQVKLDAKVNEAALLLPDGTEVDGDVVFKDEGLGLAFVRPREVPKGVEAVPLKKGRAAQVLDDVVLVGRYGRAASRAAWVDVSRVRAVVRGPHPFAICGDESSAAMGTIAYGADGAPLGIFVGRTAADGEGARSGPPQGMVILRPLSDLIEASQQAKAAKVPAAH